jgi:hypothetical protein
MSEKNIRQVMLKVISEFSKRDHNFQSHGVLDETGRRLGIHNNVEIEQAILTLWHDLFRTGHIAWGFNLSNPNPPFCHLTAQGRKALEHYSRDPWNPDGYLTYLYGVGELNPIARSYIEEALKTYNSNCFKATAVMVGAATESMVLQLRDALTAKMSLLGYTPSAGLKDWQIKKALDVIEKELKKRAGDIPKKLAQAFSAYWPAFAHQIRTVRNDAGHPTSADAITQDSVHATLLIFPELLKLVLELEAWINLSFK